MKRSYVFFALLLVAGCATPLPQTPPPGMPAQVKAPEIRVGDEWRYSIRDGYTGLERGNQSYRVTDAGPDRISVAVSEVVNKSRFGNTETAWRASNARAVADGASGLQCGDGWQRRPVLLRHRHFHAL